MLGDWVASSGRIGLFCLLLFSLSVSAALNPFSVREKIQPPQIQESWEGLLRKSSCLPMPGEPELSSDDFSFNQPFQQVLDRSVELYQSFKRMPFRATWNPIEREVQLPVQAHWSPRKEIRLSPRLVRNVRRHIERALELNYVDAITFSDMGHAHFFIPEDAWEELAMSGDSNLVEFRFEKISADPRVKMLYHTAEQIKMHDEDKKLLEDRHIQWRFFTRNLIGHNDDSDKLDLVHNETHSHNTAHEYLPGYRYWGAGFYLSANQNGCFKYKHNGEEKAFDINLNGYWSIH